MDTHESSRILEPLLKRGSGGPRSSHLPLAAAGGEKQGKEVGHTPAPGRDNIPLHPRTIRDDS
jgi:hypothetical protein